MASARQFLANDHPTLRSTVAYFAHGTAKKLCICEVRLTLSSRGWSSGKPAASHVKRSSHGIETEVRERQLLADLCLSREAETGQEQTLDVSGNPGRFRAM
jgi:hypothetical protein